MEVERELGPQGWNTSNLIVKMIIIVRMVKMMLIVMMRSMTGAHLVPAFANQHC